MNGMKGDGQSRIAARTYRPARGLPLLAGLSLTVLSGLASGPAVLAQGPGAGLPPVTGQPPRGEVSPGVPVGTLGGSVSVGVSGGVSWSTGLAFTPGPGGVQPGLSIGYSGGGYGGLGVGFSLSGLSSISRCAHTHGQDGRSETIGWDQDDRLCLDGERLVAVSGSYGAAGTEYRPRSAEHVRVIGQGASTDPGSVFLVYTPDGRVSEYGGTAAQATVLANLEAGASGLKQVPLTWSIRTVRDRWYNRMDYRYAGAATADAGWLTPRDQRIEAIEYGINANAGTAATRRVAFGYGTVSQVLSDTPVLAGAGVQRGYVAGMAFERRQVLRYVLHSVRTSDTAEWAPVREYGLDYEAVPTLKAGEPADQVRLAGLRQCDGAANCFAPTRFEWSAPGQAVAQTWEAWPGFAFDSAPFYPLPPKDKQQEPYRRAGLQVIGDFDADGVQDMLVSPEWVNVGPTWIAANAEVFVTERWELWQVKADANGPTATNIPAWGAGEAGLWVDRTGGAMVPEQLVTLPVPERWGRHRDGKAVSSAWAVNADGTYGTDVLIGRPQQELGMALADPPWGLGAHTYQGRVMPLDTPAECTGWYAYDKENDYYHNYSACEEYLSKSPADFDGHPGIMSGFEVWRLRPGMKATFERQDLGYPEGRPALWAQPADLNADRLTDLVFCKADQDYAAAAGQPMPMYYADDDLSARSWVSGTVHYALNAPGSGLDLSDGGTQVTAADANGTAQPVRCHVKDALYVLDLYGDGRESVLHRASDEAGARWLWQIGVALPAGDLEDPHPYDGNDATLTAYNHKLWEWQRAQQKLGESFYDALTYRWGEGLVRTGTGLPYDEFMRWQGRGGNHSGRYSRFMPTQAGDVDEQTNWPNPFVARSNRRVGWGSPGALQAGFGVGEARFADVNRDGLTDVLMVDLADCRYGTNQVQNQLGWPLYEPRPCSYQDVMEFGRDLWEQTYEKLAVYVYANRGDGTFEVIQTLRWWDTDLYHPDYSGTQLGNALTKGAVWNDAQEKAIYNAAWTIATTATRHWRTEFASSQIGDGNGDGAADVAVLGSVFYPKGGWIGDTMAGTYTLFPRWRVGRLDGGFREAPAPLTYAWLFDELIPANGQDGMPPWVDDGTQWVSDGKPTTITPWEAQEYGLHVRWQVGDFDRDGVDDLMLYDHVEGTWRFVHGVAKDANAPAPQLLVAVVNGLGERTQIDYAPQYKVPAQGVSWGEEDLTLPYPLVSRPSAALAVKRLHRDNGGDGDGVPTYNTTEYQYGKSVSDVLRGVALGPDLREVVQNVPGVGYSRRTERYDNAPNYDAALQAYALAGTLVGETSWVSGLKDEPIHLSHTGYRYEGQAGTQPGTWRRQLVASAATTFEVAPSVNQMTHATNIRICLQTAYDAGKECVLNQGEAYQPLTHALRWLDYDALGYLTVELIENAGTTTLNERQLKHQEKLDAYALGLPVLSRTGHEPAPKAGFTVRTTAHAYYPNGALKETTVEPERVEYRHGEEVKYDAFGNVAERWLKSDIDGPAPTFYSYSPSGAYVTEVKNAKAHVTTSQWTDPYYEACGVAERVTGPAGHTAVTDIDTFCRTTGQGSWFGAQALSPKVTTSYAEWDPDGAETYKDVDILVTTSVAGGASSHAIADRLGRNVVSQGPGFGFDVYTQTRYDVLGRAEAVSLPTKVGEEPAGWTSTKFDALGRARQVTAADGTVTTTAIDRYVTTVTDALGHSSTSTMNALGQVVRVDPPADPEQPLTAMCYGYGAFGALRWVEPCEPVPHKSAVVFEHDDYGRVTKATSAALGVRSTQYDQLGRPWLTTDAKGQQTRFAYDVLGRLTHRAEGYDTPGAKMATWLYDTILPGALTEARNGDGTVIERPHYDGYRRPAGLDTTIHGVTFSSRLDYDERGRIKRTTQPSVDANQAVGVTTLYNGLDQVIGQSYNNALLWEPLEANAFGQTVRQRYGNDLEAAAEYDPLNGRLTTASVLKTVSLNNEPPQQLPIEQFAYSWYANGLLERRTQKGLLPNVSDQSDTFFYTPRGELKAWTTLGAGGAAQSWNMSYDGYGNLTQGPAGEYGYAGERLLQVKGNAGTVSYQYDANGNVRVRDHNGVKTVIDYDALNRVEGIQEGETQSTYQMTYSADGAKVHVKETATGRETYYLGGYQRELGGKLGGQVVERINLGPAHLTRTWAGNAHKDQLTYLTPADHLGSLTLITDGDGLIQDRRSHGPWGAERNPLNWVQAQAPPQDDTHGVAAGYTGHERKRFGALIDMRARYYDPLSQRMVQSDTVIPSAFNPLAWNAYAYTYNNPVAYTDPSGHAPQGDSGAGGRELTADEVMDHVMHAMVSMENFSNSVNGNLPLMGGLTGMLTGGALGSLKAIHGVRMAVKEAEAKMAEHEKEMIKAPKTTSEEKNTVMSFDRDWWQFVRNGKQPPFRTLEEYKQWREEKEAAKSEVTGFRTPAAAAGAEMVADVTPIVGDAKGVADAYNDPSMVNIGAAIVGMIPIAGDMIAGGMKVGKAGTRLAPTGEALLSGVKNPARVFGFSGKGGRHLGDLMDMGGGVYRIHLDRGVASSIKNLPDAVNQIARTSVALLDDGVKQMSMTIPFGMDRGAFEGFRISASSLSPAPARIFFDESMNMVHLKYISE